MKRSLLIFLLAPEIDQINLYRKTYDPLYEAIQPHITIVFPFESNLENDVLISRIKKAISGVKHFSIQLSGFSTHHSPDGFYIFLDLLHGKKEIMDLHQSLYRDLQFNEDPQYIYNPHVTIGRFLSENEMTNAYRKLSTTNLSIYQEIQYITLEMIGKNEESNIIDNIHLE